jgi:hypothetical protein
MTDKWDILTTSPEGRSLPFQVFGFFLGLAITRAFLMGIADLENSGSCLPVFCR